MTRVSTVLPVLVVTACGGDDGDNDTSTVPAEGRVADLSVPEIMSPDITIPDLTTPDLSLPDGVTLPGGVTIPEITMPDISVPSISSPEDFLSQMFPQLSDEQVACLVEVGEEGQLSDPTQLMDLLGECDIDVSDLGG